MNLVFDDVRIVRTNWSLQAQAVYSRGIHLISGTVGSGKSTLALLAGKLLTPDTGEVFHKGISSMILSLQFPEYHITGPTLAAEIASWGLPSDKILEKAALSDRSDNDPLRLSRGELKRLHLECVLARSPDLLILDEPLSGLDPAEKRKYCDRIGDRRSSGITLLFTHEQFFFPPVDSISELYGGSLEMLGPPPVAYSSWRLAPPVITRLAEKGAAPANLAYADIKEALCRIRG